MHKCAVVFALTFSKCICCKNVHLPLTPFSTHHQFPIQMHVLQKLNPFYNFQEHLADGRQVYLSGVENIIDYGETPI